jgi:hypothetical protein
MRESAQIYFYNCLASTPCSPYSEVSFARLSNAPRLMLVTVTVWSARLLSRVR